MIDIFQLTPVLMGVKSLSDESRLSGQSDRLWSKRSRVRYQLFSNVRLFKVAANKLRTHLSQNDPGATSGLNKHSLGQNVSERLKNIAAQLIHSRS